MPGASDRDQLRFAVSQDRVLLSHNRRDVELLVQEYFTNGFRHAGLIVAVRRPPRDLSSGVRFIFRQYHYTNCFQSSAGALQTARAHLLWQIYSTPPCRIILGSCLPLAPNFPSGLRYRWHTAMSDPALIGTISLLVQRVGGVREVQWNWRRVSR